MESEKIVFKVPSRHAGGSGGRGVGVEKLSFSVWGLVMQVCSDYENV